MTRHPASVYRAAREGFTGMTMALARNDANVLTAHLITAQAVRWQAMQWFEGKPGAGKPAPTGQARAAWLLGALAAPSAFLLLDERRRAHATR